MAHLPGKFAALRKQMVYIADMRTHDKGTLIPFFVEFRVITCGSDFLRYRANRVLYERIRDMIRIDCQFAAIL
jgi:hypothetical protein